MKAKEEVAGDEMVRYHHQFYGHEFELTLGDSGGQRSLTCCSPWSHKESNTTQQPNNNIMTHIFPTSKVLKILHLDLDIQVLETVTNISYVQQYIHILYDTLLFSGMFKQNT